MFGIQLPWTRAWLYQDIKKNHSYRLRCKKSLANAIRRPLNLQMSVRAIYWAFKQRVGRPSAKLVLVSLADHADADGKCWPSHRTTAARTELSRDTVIRSIRLLESEGLIRIVHRRDGRSPRSNVYYLNFEVEPEKGTAELSPPS